MGSKSPEGITGPLSLYRLVGSVQSVKSRTSLNSTTLCYRFVFYLFERLNKQRGLDCLFDYEVYTNEMLMHEDYIEEQRTCCPCCHFSLQVPLSFIQYVFDFSELGFEYKKQL